MKSLKTILVAFSAIIMFASCAEQVSPRLETFVKRVETDCDQWINDSLQLSKADYQAMVDEYEMNHDTYTQMERDSINMTIGRYHGMTVRKGMEDANRTVRQFCGRFPYLIEGFISAFEGMIE